MLKQEWFLWKEQVEHQATLNDVRLVSDLSATLIGSYYIPNPNNVNFPRFETGTKTLLSLMILIIIKMMQQQLLKKDLVLQEL